MKPSEELFRLVMIAARLEAQTASRYAVDLGTLMGHGLSEESARDLLQALRPLSSSPDFAKFLEGSFLDFAKSLFALIDGICAYSLDSPYQYQIVDQSGNSLGEDLHFDFGVFRKEQDK